MQVGSLQIETVKTRNENENTDTVLPPPPPEKTTISTLNTSNAELELDCTLKQSVTHIHTHTQFNAILNAMHVKDPVRFHRLLRPRNDSVGSVQSLSHRPF